MSSTRIGQIVLLIALVLPTGCSMPLMPVPNLYRSNDAPNFFDQVPASRRSGQIPILYATDRQRIQADAAGPRYHYERAHKLAYGRATVSIGPDQGWASLCAASLRSSRNLYLKVTRRLETGHFPHYRADPPQQPSLLRAEKSFGRLVEEQLAVTDHKDVYVYIHGFNNSFDKGAMVLAQLWHFLGRRGAAVLYSWPAGRNGIFGYEADHDSADFTVAHLKQFLTALGKVRSAERVHLIAFSTGVPATLRALRELHIDHRARGVDSRRLLKLENLILVAGDFDSDVFHERILAEGVHRIPRRLTIYTATDDFAIMISEFLHSGLQRLGGINPRRSDDLAAINLLTHPDLHMVMIKPLGFLSHSYFVDHPAVSSDLILLLTKNRNPGAQNDRPLRLDPSGAWWLDHGYPMTN